MMPGQNRIKNENFTSVSKFTCVFIVLKPQHYITLHYAVILFYNNRNKYTLKLTEKFQMFQVVFNAIMTHIVYEM